MEQKDNYIVINGIKYYPVHKKNPVCFYCCSLYDDNNRDCMLKNTGIKCEADSYFVRNKNINNNNGHDYVDLDLPSGTLWATCNVGASKPSDPGLYFQWSDVQGYTKGQVGTSDGKKKFALDWSDYKWGVAPNFTKYKIYGSMLELEDDAAHVNMGGDWHIPSPDQIKELIDNTTSTWATQGGVNGRLFTSNSDSSKSIFIPAAGDALDGSVCGRGNYGNVWSSMMDMIDVNYGQNLCFNSEDIGLYNDYRCNGSSVRGVMDKIQKNG